jgi:hypothetical protein
MPMSMPSETEHRASEIQKCYRCANLLDTTGRFVIDQGEEWYKSREVTEFTHDPLS